MRKNRTRKQHKGFLFDTDMVIHLEKKECMSTYIRGLVAKDMAREQKKAEKNKTKKR